jgi:hypothetical protein
MEGVERMLSLLRMFKSQYNYKMIEITTGMMEIPNNN